MRNRILNVFVERTQCMYVYNGEIKQNMDFSGIGILVMVTLRHVILYDVYKANFRT